MVGSMEFKSSYQFVARFIHSLGIHDVVYFPSRCIWRSRVDPDSSLHTIAVPERSVVFRLTCYFILFCSLLFQGWARRLYKWAERRRWGRRATETVRSILRGSSRRSSSTRSVHEQPGHRSYEIFRQYTCRERWATSRTDLRLRATSETRIRINESSGRNCRTLRCSESNRWDPRYR